jgi:hypothetical protein
LRSAILDRSELGEFLNRIDRFGVSRRRNTHCSSWRFSPHVPGSSASRAVPAERMKMRPPHLVTLPAAGPQPAGGAEAAYRYERAFALLVEILQEVHVGEHAQRGAQAAQ